MSPKKAVSLIDAVADAGSGSAPCAKRRRLQRASTETIANEVIANNFKPPSKWDAAATHVRETGGQDAVRKLLRGHPRGEEEGHGVEDGQALLGQLPREVSPGVGSSVHARGLH